MHSDKPQDPMPLNDEHLEEVSGGTLMAISPDGSRLHIPGSSLSAKEKKDFEESTLALLDLLRGPQNVAGAPANGPKPMAVAKRSLTPFIGTND